MAYDSTWKNINDDLIGTYGGELQIRYEGDEKYLDYLTEIGFKMNYEIRLGKNIKDITNDIDPTGYITRLYPLGYINSKQLMKKVMKLNRRKINYWSC